MPDVEQRLARLEQIIDRAIAYARTTALGRRILAMLDIS